MCVPVHDLAHVEQQRARDVFWESDETELRAELVRVANSDARNNAGPSCSLNDWADCLMPFEAQNRLDYVAMWKAV
eukprot:7164053-Alexandrium_andersonii.AAC.1